MIQKEEKGRKEKRVHDKTSPDSIPVAPHALVDDYGFLACSHDLNTNIFTLRKTLDTAINILTWIGMKVDPDKCDLMHFTWRKGSNALGHNENPSLVTQLYGEKITIPAPTSIHWLGFHLDHKLSFTHHVNTLSMKGNAIVSGLRVLGNTISGISPSNLRLLYKTVIIPAITYGAPLWYNPDHPNKKLVKKLEQVQHKALIQIAGGFYDSPAEALQLLTYVPPIMCTLTKLFKSAATRIPRLPISSKITKRLPSSFIQSIPTLQWLTPDRHIPFPRHLSASVKRHTRSPILRACHVIDKNMEHAYPFHSQNAPYSLKLSSLLFAGRLFINPDACPKPKWKTLVSKQQLWLNSRIGRNTLCVFTNGSKTNKAAGWAITGIHAGLEIFTHKVPFAKKASSHDAEMMALC